MEAFESFVALAMEAEGLVVAGATKFKVKKQTLKASYAEYQEHGYEVDLVGARADKLVLATVKSFFGSNGVRPKEVTGEAGHKASGGYKLLNDVELRNAVIAQACLEYGYEPKQVEMRLYAGKFAGANGETYVREWCNTQMVGSGPIQVVNVVQLVDTVSVLAQSKTYRDNPALVAIKVLNAAAEDKAKADKLAANVTLADSDEVSRKFPIGSLVESKKDGVAGVVFAYANQGTKNPYVKIRVDETGVSYLRAASTLQVVRTEKGNL